MPKWTLVRRGTRSRANNGPVVRRDYESVDPVSGAVLSQSQEWRVERSGARLTIETTRSWAVARPGEQEESLVDIADVADPFVALRFGSEEPDGLAARIGEVLREAEAFARGSVPRQVPSSSDVAHALASSIERARLAALGIDPQNEDALAYVYSAADLHDLANMRTVAGLALGLYPNP